MKRLVPIILLIAMACESERFVPTYPSLAGDWVYTFPSGTKVEFTLTKTNDAYSISNSVITHNGQEYTAHENKFIDVDDLTFVEHIYFDGRSNPDAYSVDLSGVTTDSKFSKMEVMGVYLNFAGEAPVEVLDEVVRRTN